MLLPSHRHPFYEAVTPSRSSKLDANLACERPVSGLVVDLPECSGRRIDIEIQISSRCRVRSGCRMIEDILCVDSERQGLRFSDPDPLLEVRVDVPAAGSVNRIQAQRAQLPWRSILQDDVLPCGVRRDRPVAAELQ